MGAHYFRVGRLVVMPDYQGIGIGKRLLNCMAELYTRQIDLPFYIVTTNPQIIRASLGPNWIVKRYGHSGKIGVNNDGFMKVGKMLERSSSSGRITVSLQYLPSKYLKQAARKE
jgi:GNAT superfamily N-acetyltransferase